MIIFLLGYIWLFVHRPFEIWSWMGRLSTERVFILTAAVFWLFCHKKSTIKNINILGIFVVTASILISDFMTNMTGELNDVVENWLKIIFFAILLITSVRDQREMKIILTFFTVVFFIYMLHSYYEFMFCGRFSFRMGIPRLCGIGTSMNDPNSFGASVVYYLPVLVPLWGLFRGKMAVPARLFVIVSFALAVLCITKTGSRGGMMGLWAYILLAAAFSKHRWRILITTAIVFPIIWVSMEERMQNRYLSIIDPSRSTASARESAEGRIEGFRIGMMLFKKSPIYGFGPGSAKNYTPTNLQTHNFLGQVAGELGGIGLFAYGFLCFSITINYIYSMFYWRILKTRCPTADPYLYQVSKAVFITLLLLLLMGVWGHNAFRYTWVWYAIFQGLAVMSLKKQVADLVREQYESQAAATKPTTENTEAGPGRPVPQPV